jgi:hypothetical protein
MGKRRDDASSRTFFDEYRVVRVSRFRGTGVIDPSMRQAVIAFPNGTKKLIGVAHTRFPSGGGWSYFLCPGCARRRTKLFLIDDAPRCVRCCNALNIWHRSR